MTRGRTFRATRIDTAYLPKQKEGHRCRSVSGDGESCAVELRTDARPKGARNRRYSRDLRRSETGGLLVRLLPQGHWPSCAESRALPSMKNRTQLTSAREHRRTLAAPSDHRGKRSRYQKRIVSPHSIVVAPPSARNGPNGIASLRPLRPRIRRQSATTPPAS